jgi:hypothetical protein
MRKAEVLIRLGNGSKKPITLTGNGKDVAWSVTTLNKNNYSIMTVLQQ